MTVDKIAGEWLYVVVARSEEGDDYLGLYDKENKVNFIPTFRTKDDAQDCFLSLPREKGKRYEIQAVHIDELQEQARKNDFLVTLVDKDGKILKQLGV